MKNKAKKPAKRAVKEKKPVASTSSTSEVKFSKVTSDKLEFKAKGRVTKFAPILAEAGGLKVGEALEVSLESADAKTVTNTRNWLAALVKKHVTPPKGTAIVVRTTTGGKLGICCEKSGA